MLRANITRVVLITLDGLGVGALPDAAAYGDDGADTLGHLLADQPAFRSRLPHLTRLGLGNLHPAAGLTPVSRPQACFGKMAERSPGKDTTTGHWELAGLVQTEPLPTFPQGFPPDIIAAFTRETGLAPLGNIAADGIEVLDRLGVEHLRSGRPILYTSVDSVFQLAAHEDILPVERLYELCRIARRILDPYRIGRVIARPFVGEGPGNFRRTARRHDFSLAPFAPTLLDHLHGRDLTVIGVGKIGDIFAGRGLSRSLPSRDNAQGMELILESFAQVWRGLVFANLVDFDMLYGHRRDPAGFARALEEFDSWLPRMQQAMGEADLLVVTADHGCDPTAPGTDHTREYVPLLVWSPALVSATELGCRESFADVAATLGEAFGVPMGMGKSFLAQLSRS
ncbi:phosphopentomutase [Geoalkalibacter sp.]|uniref:phosphopentomutase n=1 Tax=Geoalkalibacter sp. TaxID=3041440 RepID=UPI00272E7107|nr:phosphopentomutase [Geoalkalibacter sp.]